MVGAGERRKSSTREGRRVVSPTSPIYSFPNTCLALALYPLSFYKNWFITVAHKNWFLKKLGGVFEDQFIKL
jgi:hypothetical protein